MSERSGRTAAGHEADIVDVPERERYELRLGGDDGSPGDGSLAAFLDYRLAEGRIALLHTEVLEGYEGQGLGSRLADWVFDDARRRGIRIIPRCPFIVRWLERHPEQHDVLLHPFEGPPAGGSRTPLESI